MTENRLNQIIKESIYKVIHESMPNSCVNPIDNEPFELLSDYTPEEKKAQRIKANRQAGAKKAAETRRRNKEKKREEAFEKLIAKQREYGYFDLFGN